MKIDPLIKHIISMSNVDLFSTVEVRTAYITLANDQTLDKNKVRHFVNDELLKLVNAGWLKKTTSKQKKITRFKKTSLFNPDEIETRDQEVNELHQASISDFQKSVKSEIHFLNTELLKVIGELETYVAMRDKCPAMHADLNKLIHDIREQSHILRGKIHGSKNILNLIKEKNTNEIKKLAV